MQTCWKQTWTDWRRRTRRLQKRKQKRSNGASWCAERLKLELLFQGILVEYCLKDWKARNICARISLCTKVVEPFDICLFLFQQDQNNAVPHEIGLWLQNKFVFSGRPTGSFVCKIIFACAVFGYGDVHAPKFVISELFPRFGTLYSAECVTCQSFDAGSEALNLHYCSTPGEVRHFLCDNRA